MGTTTIASYLIFQVFFGLSSFQYSLTARAAPEDLSLAEIKLWRENTLLAAAMNVALLVARVNGIAFLVYLGYRTEWLNAIMLFVAGLVLSVLLGAAIRKVAGTIVPALIGYVVMPVTGIVMWFTLM